MKAKRKFKDYALKHAKIRKEKKVKGFTLVELIVVIAIIGVLAAILIPTMMGRVKDARYQTANDAAAKLAEQAQIVASDLEAAGTTVSFAGGFYATATDADLGKFKGALIKALPDLDNAEWGVYFDNNTVVAAYYLESGSKYCGTYPKKNNDKGAGETLVGESVEPLTRFNAALKEGATSLSDAGQNLSDVTVSD